MLPPYYSLFNVDTYNRELWYLTSLSTIFKLYRSDNFFLVEETRLPRENHRPAGSHRQTLSHIVVSSTLRLSGIRTPNVSGNKGRSPYNGKLSDFSFYIDSQISVHRKFKK